MIGRKAKTRSARRSASSRRTHQRRWLSLESLEARLLMARLTNGTGDGQIEVFVNEQGAFGRSPNLDVTFRNFPQNNTIGDARYNPVGARGLDGTTYESAIAIGIVDPVTGLLAAGENRQFMTAGFITGGQTLQNGGNTSGRFLQPTATRPQNDMERNSRFFYPNNVPVPTDPNQINTRGQLPPGAQLMIDLRQTLVDLTFMGGQDGTALVQEYTIENVSQSAMNFEIVRYWDGDIFTGGTPVSDGGGERIFDVRRGVNSVYQTDTASGFPVADPTFIEIQSSLDGVPTVARWEVGLADRDPPPDVKELLPTHILDRILNPPNPAACNPLCNDIIPANADAGNDDVRDAPDDVAVGLRNVYLNVAGDPIENPSDINNDPLTGGVVVFTTITVFGHPPRTPIPTPPIPQFGRVEGTKYLDRNGNGMRDPGEPGVPGFTIFADRNQNGMLDANEVSTITDQDGFYAMDLDLGMHQIREVQQPRWTQTGPLPGAPNSMTGDFYMVNLTTNMRIVSNLDFGNVPDPGEIRGVKFEDDNRSGVRETGERAIEGVTIYLDLDDDGILDPTEPSTVTDAQGNYVIMGLEPGTYTVREIVPEGFEQTSPGGGGAHRVSITPGVVRTGIDFGNRLLRGSIQGVKWNDLDGDGVRDNNEPGVGGVVIYLDANNNGVFNLGEKAAVTDAFGNYSIGDLLPGIYTVRELASTGTEITFPAAGFHLTQVFPGLPSIADFGNRASFDFGDAPDSYGTLLSSNGARHALVPGFRLGARIDGEPDGQPSPNAIGDDVNGGGFGAPINFSVGDDPEDLLLADIDGDGLADLVTADTGSNEISIALGLGDGTFGPPTSFDVDDEPVGVFAADLDGVNGLDLIVAHRMSDDVFVLLNNGAGGFGTPLVFDAEGPQNDVVAVRADDDDRIDIVVARGAPNNDVVLLRNITVNNLSFADPIVITPPTIPVQINPIALEVAELNNDGLADLVVVNNGSNSISVLRNTPGGNFATPVNIPVGMGPQDVTIADLNGDGFRDLAVANELSDNVTILLNNGNGVFPLGLRSTYMLLPVGSRPTAITAGLFDGRPGVDLAVALFGTDEVAVLSNDGNGSFLMDPLLAPTAPGPVEVLATLLDTDTIFDIVTLNRDSDSVSTFTFTGGDEDGVLIRGPFVPGRPSEIVVSATAAGVLSAWFDFNRDNVFTAADQVLRDIPIAAGATRFDIPTPAGLADGPVFARFRFSNQNGLGPTGPAASGEVEDYQILVQAAGAPTGHTNLANPEDVDNNGRVELFDVLLIVRDLQANGVRRLLPVVNPPPPPPFLDVNRNEFVDMDDVLRVVQRLVLLQGLAGENEAEGEPEDEFESALDDIASDVTLAWMEQ